MPIDPSKVQWDEAPAIDPSKVQWDDAPKKLAPADTPGIGQTVMISAGRTFDKIGDGLAQMYLAAKGEKSSLDGLRRNVEAKDELYKPLQAARPIATALGESLPYMAVPIGAGSTALSTAGRLALSGAAPGAIEYGSIEDRAKKAAIGATSALAGGYLVPKVAGLAKSGASKVVRKVAGEVSPEARALYSKASEFGIPVNAAQLSDSKPLKVLQSTVDKLPFSGAAKSRDAQQSAFNRAVSRQFGENTDRVTTDVYAAAKGRIGAEFERLSANNTLNASDDLLGRLSSIQDEAAKFGTDDSARAVRSSIDELLSKVDANGKIPGRAYQALDSKLGGLTKSGGEKAHFLGQLRETLRDAMDGSIAEADKAAWATARSQYRALKTVRDLIAKSTDGNVSPALLMGRVNANNAGKEAMAAGRGGNLGDLAKIGQRFVKDPVPDSGTAQRLWTLGGVGGLASITGLPAAALTAGATMAAGRGVNKALNSQSVMRGLLDAGPSFADVLAENPGLLSFTTGRLGGLLAGQLANQ